MKKKLLPITLPLAFAQILPAWAQENNDTPAPEVRITGSVSDTEARREFVAGKVVIGRKRIEESGARKVDEILRREPSITVGSDGRISLLNMPGYTQVLVDGRQPLGESPLEFDVARVEKIEIVKSSMAEFGPFGIAGTINIITRKTNRRTETQVSAGVSNVGGKPGAEFTLAHNRSSAGSPFRYSFQVSADRGAEPEASRLALASVLRDGREAAQWSGWTGASSRDRGGELSGDVTWEHSPSDTVRFAPRRWQKHTNGTENESRRWSSGAELRSWEQTRVKLETTSLLLSWTHKFAPRSQLQVDAFAADVRQRMNTQREDDMAGMARARRNDDVNTTGSNRSLELVYKTRLENGHDFKVGATQGRVGMRGAYHYALDGMPVPALASLMADSQSRRRETTIFFQDEWEFNSRLSANAGVSAADTSADLNQGPYAGRIGFRLWAPSIHLAHKIGSGNDRQLRLSIARSFKAPDTDVMSLRPTVNPLAPCPLNAACGTNTVDTADDEGNLALRPERALAVNLGYEHGLGDDSQVTLELFSRRIADKMGNAINLRNVPWASVPRYVSRPENLGVAHTVGINLEGDVALRDLYSRAPKLAVSGNVELAASRVSSLPGPDNRVDQQTPWSAKLSADYDLDRLPLKLSLSASWTPSVWSRTSSTERVRAARRANLHAGAQWKLRKDARFVMSWKTSRPGTGEDIDEFMLGDESLRLYKAERRFSSFRLAFETAL